MRPPDHQPSWGKASISVSLNSCCWTGFQLCAEHNHLRASVLKAKALPVAPVLSGKHSRSIQSLANQILEGSPGNLHFNRPSRWLMQSKWKALVLANSYQSWAFLVPPGLCRVEWVPEREIVNHVVHTWVPGAASPFSKLDCTLILYCSKKPSRTIKDKVVCI